jgi:NAD(P)-dependent dehydrogenase (short-subunit alcohol dehydrogenase family)
MPMRYILITGASSKIGDKIVDYYIKTGDFIIYHYFLNRKVKNTKNICYLQCDFLKLNDVIEFFFKITERFKVLDLLINNASIFVNDNQTSLTEMISINYEAPKLLNELYKKKYKKGCIVNMIDCRILSPNKDHNKKLYYDSKYKLYRLTENQAFEFGSTFRINGICIGIVTPSEYYYGKALEDRINRCILKKKVDFHDIILTIEFLYNNKSITGQSITVDSGESIKA